MASILSWYNYFYVWISTLLVLSVILDLNQNVLESAKLSSGWSLQYCHELAEGLA